MSRQLSVPSTAFDYSIVHPKKARSVRAAAAKIRHLVFRTLECVVEIGKELESVKEVIPHGRFGEWLEAEFGWKERTARNFMNVARRFKSANFADLDMDVSAAYLLAAPSAPPKAVEEAIERAQSGERITHMTAARILRSHDGAPSKVKDPQSLDAAKTALRKALEKCSKSWPPRHSSVLARMLREFAAGLERPTPRRNLRTARQKKA